MAVPDFGAQISISPAVKLAVLPLGAMESHGPHLPLDTDSFLATALLDRAVGQLTAQERAVLRLPVIWLGASGEHAHANGTLTREPEALIADILAVGAGLAQAGVRKLLIFNAHGGNVAAARIAALKLRRQDGMLAASAHWLDFGLPGDLALPTPAEQDIHGGWLETSLMLHLAPHRVGRQGIGAYEGRAPAAMLFPDGPIDWGWRTDDLGGGGAHPSANCVGRPDLASAEIGRQLADHAGRELATLMEQLVAAPWPPERAG
jgi:creatinine amidohydrolase